MSATNRCHMGRIGGLAVAFFLIAGLGPQTTSAAEPASAEISRRIDEAIETLLKEKKIRPSARADDARLVRRLHLDLLGRVPTAAETEAFLADSSPDRVHRLVDRLLAHPEMPVYWRRVIDGWFNPVNDQESRRFGHDEFLAWLERSLAANKPWDRMARELLLPSATDAEQRGASYFLSSRLQGEKADQLDNLATSVASSLFGVQLQCAKCHDHPFVNEWKQDHYYGLAAFFNRLEAKNEGGRFTLIERPAGEVKFVTRKKAEKTASAMFLDSKVLDAAVIPTKSAAEKKDQANGVVNRRQKLADHALNPDSPYFKRSLVNRVWKQLLGRGLVEPVDQMHNANPASHPALLDALADDFAKNRFDLRRLMTGILHSETYLRDSRFPGPTRPADELYAATILKPLTGEQMAWSLVVATGNTDTLAGRYAKDLKPAPARGEITPALRRRWEKEREFEQVVDKFRASGDSFQANVGQALFATFNPFTQKALQPGQGNLVQRMASEKGEQAARLAFLSILARAPSTEELKDVASYLASAADRKQASADVVWALLTMAEFRFNH